MLIPLPGLINIQNELSRLDKELAKIEKDIEFATNKLQNPTFCDKAPQEILASIQDKLKQATEMQEKLIANRAKISALQKENT